MGFKLEGLVMPTLVSSDILATGSELTMPRIATLCMSQVAYFPDYKYPIVLFCVQRPLELRFRVCSGLELENEK